MMPLKLCMWCMEADDVAVAVEDGWAAVQCGRCLARGPAFMVHNKACLPAAPDGKFLAAHSWNEFVR